MSPFGAQGEFQGGGGSASGGGGGGGITGLTGDVVASGSGSQVATVEGFRGVSVSATPATNGQAYVLVSGVWTAVNLAAFLNQGDLFVGVSAGVGEILPKGSSGQVLTVGGADPSGLEYTTIGLSPPNKAITVTSNAGTATVADQLQTFTNSSAATMAITLATASAVDGAKIIIRIYDFSGVSETIGWTNTENSNISVPTSSNGSTTQPLTVGFMFNAATTKWRCLGWV